MIVWDESLRSPSFPNLTTQYRLHHIVCRVRGLPKGELMTAQGVQAHYWEWRKDSHADDIRFNDEEVETLMSRTCLVFKHASHIWMYSGWFW